ncbi:glucose-inhibited division family A protein [Zea mays]|uniref:Glucose-inhibited division family A protein n=1 Tax=Zea mays TaxID=4577 RepID=A0A1D6K986_MAIZE|nr:glucose-inhibited division family A protein [Zea mays]
MHLLLVLPGNEVWHCGRRRPCRMRGRPCFVSPRRAHPAFTLNIDRIAWQGTNSVPSIRSVVLLQLIYPTQPCNPAVGGPAKSQLVHEVDAFGGEIGKNTDRCYLQKRVLNSSKGPVVRALRAQTDKREYAIEMKNSVERSIW